MLLDSTDYKGKTIKQVLIDKAFSEILINQDSETAAQAIQLIFTMIQPKNVEEPEKWWNQQFESIITNDAEITIDMEFNEEGLKFIEEMV